MFLADQQIAELTGYKRPSAQRRWLIRNGYRFEVRGDGRPCVMVAEAERHMLGKTKSKRGDMNYKARGLI